MFQPMFIDIRLAGWAATQSVLTTALPFTSPFNANQTAADDLTSKVKSSVDAWVPILGHDDDTVAAKVVADDIDVLVDLSGHTAGNRLGVFARRPARVQVTWLGYFATTGLPAIDYVLLDGYHMVPGAEQLFVEKVIRLPGCRFCYGAPTYAGDPAPPPSLGRGIATFGSFNNAAKINNDVLALWAQVLAAVPDSNLLLKWRSYVDPILQGRTRFEFAKYGIDPQRIKFDGKTEHRDMLSQYSQSILRSIRSRSAAGSPLARPFGWESRL